MCLTSEQRDFEGLLASADLLLLLVTDLELPAPLVNSRFPTCAVGLRLQNSLSPCRSIWSSSRMSGIAQGKPAGRKEGSGCLEQSPIIVRRVKRKRTCAIWGVARKEDTRYN